MNRTNPNVLNSMYHGEVNVAQDELNSFLAVAEDLKVKDTNSNYVAFSSKPNHPGQPGKVLKYDAAVPSQTPTHFMSVSNQPMPHLLQNFWAKLKKKLT